MEKNIFIDVNEFLESNHRGLRPTAAEIKMDNGGKEFGFVQKGSSYGTEFLDRYYNVLQTSMIDSVKLLERHEPMVKMKKIKDFGKKKRLGSSTFNIDYGNLTVEELTFGYVGQTYGQIVSTSTRRNEFAGYRKNASVIIGKNNDGSIKTLFYDNRYTFETYSSRVEDVHPYYFYTWGLIKRNVETFKEIYDNSPNQLILQKLICNKLIQEFRHDGFQGRSVRKYDIEWKDMSYDFGFDPDLFMELGRLPAVIELT